MLVRRPMCAGVLLEEEDGATNDRRFPDHEIYAGQPPPVLQVAAALRIVAGPVAENESGAWSAITMMVFCRCDHAGRRMPRTAVAGPACTSSIRRQFFLNDSAWN
jgi:hypothetical protein